MGYNDFRQKYGLTAKPGAPSQADAGGPGEVVAPPAPADTPEPEVAPPEPPRPRQVTSEDQARRAREQAVRAALGSNAAPTGPVEDSVGAPVEAPVAASPAPTPPPAPPPAPGGAAPAPGGQPSLIEELNAQHMAQDPTPGWHIELSPPGQSSEADRNPLRVAAVRLLVEGGMDPPDAWAGTVGLTDAQLRHLIGDPYPTRVMRDLSKQRQTIHPGRRGQGSQAEGRGALDVAGSILRHTLKNMLLGDMSPEELRRLADEMEQ